MQMGVSGSSCGARTCQFLLPNGVKHYYYNDIEICPFDMIKLVKRAKIL